MSAPRRIQAISAIVCNYDGEDYLEECLCSVLEQEVDEVILVDNGSTDGSVALVRERFPEVEVVALSENRGPCVGRNAGMRAAKHRWVLAVDVDAVLAPGLARRLREVLEERPDVIAAQPRSVLHAEPERVHYDGGAFHYIGLFALRNFYTPLAEAEGEGVVPADGLIGICALLDRDVVLALGGYDERYFYLAEDLDLALRLRLAGHGIVSVEDILVRHKGGTAGLSFRGGNYPERRAYLHSRNRWFLIAKCYHVRTILVSLPGLLLYEAAWLVFAAKQGQLGAHLRGKLDFFRALPALLRTRPGIQAQRRVPDRRLLVGGPLTLSPSLVEKPLARRAARLLDLLLRGWWGCARWLAG